MFSLKKIYSSHPKLVLFLAGLLSGVTVSCISFLCIGQSGSTRLLLDSIRSERDQISRENQLLRDELAFAQSTVESVRITSTELRELNSHSISTIREARDLLLQTREKIYTLQASFNWYDSHSSSGNSDLDIPLDETKLKE